MGVGHLRSWQSVDDRELQDATRARAPGRPRRRPRRRDLDRRARTRSSLCPAAHSPAAFSAARFATRPHSAHARSAARGRTRLALAGMAQGVCRLPRDAAEIGDSLTPADQPRRGSSAIRGSIEICSRSRSLAAMEAASGCCHTISHLYSPTTSGCRGGRGVLEAHADGGSAALRRPFETLGEIIGPSTLIGRPRLAAPEPASG